MRAFAVVVFASLIMAGCSSTPLSKIGGDGTLPQELPKEMQDRFEVKDADASPFPSPFESAIPGATATTPASGAKKIPPAAGAKKPDEKTKKAELTKPVPKGKKKGKGKAAVEEPQTPAPVAFAWPNRRPPIEPIWIGETLVYDVSYFGVSAGDFTLKMLPPKVINNRKVYHARGTAISSPVFNVFYRLNDIVESYFDFEGFFSHRFHILLDETKQTRDSLELNDSEKAQTYYWNRWNRPHAGYVEVKEFHPITPFSQDSLSALYYLRSQPLKNGDVVTFPVVSEGKTWEAVVTVLGREMMRTPLGKISVIKLQPDHKYQGILKKNGDSFIWLSDDDRKFLIRMEAKVRIGTVVAMIKSAELGNQPEAVEAPAVGAPAVISGSP